MRFGLRIRRLVFWPPFLLLVCALAASIIQPDPFAEAMRSVNASILDIFGGGFSALALFALVLCFAFLVSPAGRVKIGGPTAKPFLSRWRWFSIVLCTTIATGIIFWGTAEPMFHFTAPPPGAGLPTEQPETARFALSTMFLHWSFTPYAMYCVPALAFAVAFYNRHSSFSLSSCLFPFFPNKRPSSTLSAAIDAICLFALVAGMAASLGAGILTLTGGIERLTSWDGGFGLSILLGGLIVVAFSISAASGLLKGIRILSDINVRIFVVLALVVLVLGPTREVLSASLNALTDYGGTLFSRHWEPIVAPTAWHYDWTVFYWANWLAWAPVTALFLGRIAYGYTVREFLLFNWVLPACFGVAWMSIFGGTTLQTALDGTAPLAQSLANDGPESVIFVLFEAMPGKYLLSGVFLATAFLSYVTAADSNTTAMGGLSSSGISPDAPVPPTAIKLIWGAIVGAAALVMLGAAGLDGVRMLSNLGGLPSLFLVAAIGLGLVRGLVRPGKWLAHRDENAAQPAED